MRNIKHSVSRWPLQKAFVISRGARTEAEVIQLMIEQDGKQGFAECVPYARYGESLESVVAEIDSVSSELKQGATTADLQPLLPAGAARNIVDCALWDLQAKLTGKSVGQLSELGDPPGLVSAQTISIGSVDEMASEARGFSNYPVLKAKLDSENIIARVAAIHQNAPQSKIILDANEAWSIDTLNGCWHDLQQMNVVLLEQPLPAADDNDLLDYNGSLPVCADESCHTSIDVPSLANRYQAINIKLDKTGGLTEAINTFHAGKQHNLQIMVGCMVGTSLAMAPATLLGQHADIVDLDGPALLAEDVAHGFHYHRGQMSPLSAQLWGGKR